MGVSAQHMCRKAKATLLGTHLVELGAGEVEACNRRGVESPQVPPAWAAQIDSRVDCNKPLQLRGL